MESYDRLKEQADAIKEKERVKQGLTFIGLRGKNVLRCETIFHPLDEWSPTEWAVALAGEVGEACNAVKKLRRLADGTNTAKDPQTEAEAIKAIGEELADVVIYADLLAARLGLDLGFEVAAKFNAVSALRDSEIFL